MRRVLIVLMGFLLLSSMFIVSSHAAPSGTSIDIRAIMDSRVYLESQEFKLYYTVYWTNNNTPIVDVSVKWSIMDSYMSLVAGPFWSSSSPIISDKLENLNLTSGEYHVKLECNYTLGHTTYTTFKTLDFYVGYLRVNLNVIDLTAPYQFYPGHNIKIGIMPVAAYFHTTSVLKNAFINYTTIWYTDEEGNVTILENYTAMLTGPDGTKDIIWTIPELPEGTIINITTLVSYGKSETLANFSFRVNVEKHLYLELNKEQYLSGDDLELVAHTNVEVVYYQFELYHLSNLLYYYAGRKNSISYYIPLDFQGEINVKVYAFLPDGSYLYDYAWLHVAPAYLDLKVSQHTYGEVGEQITVYTKSTSHIMKNPTYYYTVEDSDGNVVKSVSTSSSTFTFEIPSLESRFYTISVKAVDSEYTVYNNLAIFREDKYVVNAFLLTKSKYESNVYSPGDTVKIGYNISKYGLFNSTPIILHWKILNTENQGTIVLNETQLQGNFTIKIPEDFQGSMVMTLWVDSGTYSSDASMLSLEVHEPSWAMESYAGMPMGTFLAIVISSLALILSIVAIIMLLLTRRKKEEFSKPRAPRPFTEKRTKHEEIAEPYEEEEFEPEL